MKLRSGLVLLPSALSPAIAVCSSCSDEGPVAPDTGSPLIEVRFPTSASVFDRDDDGLVDLEIAFSDSGSGIDTATIQLTANRSLKGGPGNGSDLVAVWTVVRADSAGLVIEETVEHLLPRGEATLTVSVSDKAGNLMSREVSLNLPPATRHKVIDLQASQYINTSIVATPDGRRIYAITYENQGTAISVVDAGSLEWVKTERTSVGGGARMAVDTAMDRLYAVGTEASLLLVFDLTSETFLPPIEISAHGIDVAVSHTRREAYIGHHFTGSISVIDLDRGVEERVIEPGIGSMTALVFDASEDRLFAGTWALDGILVVDPDTGHLLSQIGPSSGEEDQLAGVLDVIRDGDVLIATSVNALTGEGRIAVVPLADPDALRFGSTGEDRPIRVTVSPDRREYAMTSANASTDHAVKVMDAGTLEVIWEDRPPPPADVRRGIVFRPDGHAFFTVGAVRDTAPTGAPNELTVYLYR